MFAEGMYKPSAKLGVNLRLQYFETGGYNSRIYVYETDVLYGYSIPAFSGTGFRQYFNLSYDVSKRLTAWLRWAQTAYKNQSFIGSGLEQIRGNKRTEVKMQVRYLFKEMLYFPFKVHLFAA